MRVLVTNASYWNCLAAVRSLGQHGMQVVVAGPKRDSIVERQGVATWSRFCSKRDLYTDPLQDIERYAEDIAMILRKERIDVFCPIGIKEVLSTLRFEDELRPLAPIPFGSLDVVSRANDKALAMRAAKAADVPFPETLEIDDIDQLISTSIELPLVVKTRVGAASQGVWFVRTPAQWEDILARIASKRAASKDETKLFFDADQFIVQEHIPGRVHDVCLLADHGRVRALLTQKRLKTASLEGGAGHMNITTDEPVLADYARRLVSELNYHGPAQLEFIQDERDGSFNLLEINAKFWGTLALSIAAGIDFPHLATQLALGTPFDDCLTYEVGLTYRWRFPGEVVSWARQRRQGVTLRSIFAPTPGPVRTDWQWNDPLPSLNQIMNTAWRLVRTNGDYSQ